jgi:predicted metalloprotease with PDZ domain
LLAFATDLFIRKNSNNEKSLDNVMRYLYNEFALNGKGYSDIDYKGVVENFANKSYDEIFHNYINKASDYEPMLKEAMEYIGCELIKYSSPKFNEHALGIKVNEVAGVCKVTAVYPDSVADLAGISINDDILIVNNIQIKPDASGTSFTEWCNYFGNEVLKITFSTNGMIKQTELVPKPGNYYKIVRMEKKSSANEIQKSNFEKWSNNKF